MKLLLGFCLAAAALAASFPAFDAETLSGKKLVMPSTAAGHPVLLIIGFTQASQKQSDAWGKRLKTDYPGGTPAELYIVAELEAAPRFVRGMIASGMRSGVPKAEHDHFLMAFKGEAELKQAVSFAKAAENDAWLVLLNPDGSVKWQAHGAPADAVVAQLKSQW